MPDEIELKLTIPQDRVAALRRSPLLRSLASGRAVTRRQKSVYFDTPGLTLAKNAIALRVRHIGLRRIQTLKLPSGQSNGLQVHRELECEIRGDRPDLTRIDDEALQRFFAENDIANAIAPVFETDVSRSVRRLWMEDSEIEFALDRGEIRGAGRQVPICEAELELRSGKSRRLFEVALALNAEVPLVLGQQTKSARGYALIRDARPQPQRAHPVALDADMTAKDAFCAIARNCLVQMRANEACAMDGTDPEGIHQLRVGVRRLRALVAAFRPLFDPQAHATLAEELRWLQQGLGRARDWDVFVEETLTRLQARLPDDPDLQRLAHAASEARAAAQCAARSVLTGARYTSLLLTLELSLDSAAWARPEEEGTDDGALRAPAEAFAEAVLTHRHRRLRKLGDRHATLTEPELHVLRLQGKKMRYLGEFFRSLYPRRASRKYLGALADIQDRLGSLNDAVVTRGLLVELGQDDLKANGIVTGWQAARIEQDLAALGAAWERFRACKPFWKA